MQQTENIVWSQKFEWRRRDLLALFVYVGLLGIAILEVPNRIWEGGTGRFILVIGVLGAWRYTWWFTHFVRAQIYEHIVYARLRRRAEALWHSGWRPEKIHFLMTTYLEERRTSEKAVLAIIREVREAGVPGTLYVGSALAEDEAIIADTVTRHAKDIDLEVVVVRQQQSGKRVALGLAMRAMSRRGIGGDAPVVILDGDSILARGCLRKCLPLFQLCPKVDAMTTREKAIVFGSTLVQKWFDTRFAQRQMNMQSHALSRMLLTLTGRMSIFRASAVVDRDFIETVENDQLEHWLWGKFRFLCGDDKSTCYAMMRRGSEMLYVPDAMVFTIEQIGPPVLPRILANTFRWSGNTLRNGMRIITLGPRRVGPFVWWCSVDQRLAMWTAVIGFTAMVLSSIFVSVLVLYASLIWIAGTRLIYSLALSYYNGRLDLTFPFVLYGNQIGNAMVKIFVLFRLPMQRWSHRGNQELYGRSSLVWRMKGLTATALTLVSVFAFVVFILTYIGVLPPPTMESIRFLFGR